MKYVLCVVAVLIAGPIAANEQATISSGLRQAESNLKRKISDLKKVNKRDLLKFLKEHAPNALKHLENTQSRTRSPNRIEEKEAERELGDFMSMLVEQFNNQKVLRKDNPKAADIHLQLIKAHDQVMAVQLEIHKLAEKGHHDRTEEKERKVRFLMEKVHGLEGKMEEALHGGEDDDDDDDRRPDRGHDMPEPFFDPG